MLWRDTVCVTILATLEPKGSEMTRAETVWAIIDEMTFQEAVDFAGRILESADDSGWTLNTMEQKVEATDMAGLLTAIAEFEVVENISEDEEAA